MLVVEALLILIVKLPEDSVTHTGSLMGLNAVSKTLLLVVAAAVVTVTVFWFAARVA